MPAIKKTFNNISVKDVLNKYASLFEACQDYPFIDDILHGVARIDLGGNTRPLSKGMLFNLLATVDNIETNSVRLEMNTSVHAKITGRTDISNSHASKVATGLRTASMLLAREFARHPNKARQSGYCFGSDNAWQE